MIMFFPIGPISYIVGVCHEREKLLFNTVILKQLENNRFAKYVATH
jgi:hypothetical protein